MRYLHDPLSLLPDAHNLYAAVDTRRLPELLTLVYTGLEITHISNPDSTFSDLLEARAEIESLYADLPPYELSNASTLATLQFADIPHHRERVAPAAELGADRASLNQRLHALDQWLYRGEDDDIAFLNTLQILDVERINSTAWQVYSIATALQLDQMLAITSKYAGIIVGSPHDDVYTNSSAWLIFDPGGNDTYVGRTGHANATLGCPLTIIVDCSGNDVYKGSEIGGPASAIMGITLLHDRGGNDNYGTAILSSAAAVGGAAILIDESGDDHYRSTTFSQGFASFGTGALIDMKGNDMYTVNGHGQAYGGVRGYGLLCDLDGHDVYVAGRDTLDTGRYGSRFISIAQGVGMGMRPCASGGIGCLADARGNDHYIADVFGQGVGYWYGTGMLIDSRGEDHYQLYEYGQGAGVHMACGLLVEGDGNDTFTLRGGIGQGAAHDFSVGALLEMAGNDQYQGHITVQGTAINNSVAVLHDLAGDDWYCSWSEWSQGYGAWAERRDFGSLGFCIDESGRDTYHDVDRNGFIDIRGWQGVCVDVPEKPTTNHTNATN